MLMIVFSRWRPRPGRYCRTGRGMPPSRPWLAVSPLPGPWLGVVGGMASPSASWLPRTLPWAIPACSRCRSGSRIPLGSCGGVRERARAGSSTCGTGPALRWSLRRRAHRTLMSGGLRHDADVGPRCRPALWIALPGFIVGDGASDDHVLALPPVDRRGDLMLRGELERVDHAQDLIEVAPGGHGVDQDQ